MNVIVAAPVVSKTGLTELCKMLHDCSTIPILSFFDLSGPCSPSSFCLKHTGFVRRLGDSCLCVTRKRVSCV